MLVLGRLLLLASGGVSAFAADNWSPGSGWTLAWSDEFNGTAVDSANWTFETGGGGWGNNELETYTASAATVQNGELVITANRNADGSYTSARLKTQDKHAWTYGKIAARMRLPKGQGIWPAFWMLGSNLPAVGWPKCGENRHHGNDRRRRGPRRFLLQHTRRRSVPPSSSTG
ncbi:MAG: glycoside hydrolase family 16 protein [Lacunisphaera sp.]